MNNKPVAWIGTEAIKTDWDFVPVTKNKRFDSDVALYTHPAKTLTDEEIEEFAYAFELWQLNNPDKTLEGIIAFARAILRKAQSD